MTTMPRASATQATFIKAILEHGGHRVPGSKVFGKRDDSRIKIQTIDSCKRNNWVTRDELNGVALWSVTQAGLAAAVAS